MKHLSLIILLLAAPLMGPPLAAQTTDAPPLMSASEFDAYTRGKTLYYGQKNLPYGGETYLDNRRVLWSFLDGNCKDGEWYEDDGHICFIYEDRSDPQCWTFRRGPNGLIAQFKGDAVGAPLYEAEDRGMQMLCLGPEIGV